MDLADLARVEAVIITDVVLPLDIEGREGEETLGPERLCLDADLVLLTGLGLEHLAIDGSGGKERLRVGEEGRNTDRSLVEQARLPGEGIVFLVGAPADHRAA